MNFEIKGLKSKEKSKLELICQLYENKEFKGAQQHIKKFIKKLEEPELANTTEIFYLKELIDF